MNPMDNEDPRTVVEILAAIDAANEGVNTSRGKISGEVLTGTAAIEVASESLEHVRQLSSRLSDLESFKEKSVIAASEEFRELRRKNNQLASRVRRLEQDRREGSCLLATVVLVVVLFVCMVGTILVLAYAEHRWNIPVFSTFAKPR